MGKMLLLINKMIFILLISSVTAEADEQMEKNIADMYQVSGLEGHLKSVFHKKGMLIATASRLGVTKNEKLVALMSGVFDPIIMKKTAMDTLREGYDARLATQALSAFKKKPALKMLQQEEIAARPENKKQMREFFISLKGKQAELKERIAIIKKLDDAIFTSEWMVGTLEDVHSSLDTFFDKKVRTGKISQQEYIQVRSHLSKQLTEYRKALPGLMFLMYAHQDSSDQELNAYLTLCETDYGQWFSTVYKVALMRVFQANMEIFTRNAMNILL